MKSFLFWYLSWLVRFLLVMTISALVVSILNDAVGLSAPTTQTVFLIGTYLLIEAGIDRLMGSEG